jgi:hypothetical protein
LLFLAPCNQPTSLMVSLSNHAQQHCHPDNTILTEDNWAGQYKP